MSASEGPEWFDTELAEGELDPTRPAPFDTPWGHFSLYTVAGEVVCAASFCPHMAGPLFQGTQRGEEVTCPWHQWRYSLLTGKCTDSPRGEGAGSRIERLAVRQGSRGTYELRPQE